MKDTMLRFLKSIHIENVDDFDIDFEMVGRNRFNPKILDMVIIKETPWNYQLLRQFQDALGNITYPYTLRFSYLSRPDGKNVIHLFNEWYQTIYRIPDNLVIEVTPDDYFIVKYESEMEKEQFHSAVNDFRDFLHFLSYEFVVREIIEPRSGVDQDDLVFSSPSPEAEMKKEIRESLARKNTPDPVPEEATVPATPEKPEAEEKEECPEAVSPSPEAASPSPEAKEESASEEPAEEEPEEEKPSASLAEKQHAEEQAAVEDKYLRIMEKNAQIMKEERERQRLNRRGDYRYIEKLDDLDEKSGNVDFNGTVFSNEAKEFGGITSLTLGVNDAYGGAIEFRIRENRTITKEIMNQLVPHTNVRVRGVTYIDSFSHQLTMRVHYIDVLPPDVIEPEKSTEHRVELHLHSKMSSMDAVTNMMDYCKYAKALGHTCISVTDHAVVQAYPEAQKAAKKTGMKMLYGVEFYMVDDEQIYIKNPCETPLNHATYVVLDTETTGLSSKYNRIIEFGAVRVENGTVTASFDQLINPGVKIPAKITEITNITNSMIEGQPTTEEAMPKILEFIGDAILVTHNARFDISFLNETLKRMGLPELTNPVIDTLALSRYLFPESKKHRLGSLCRNMDIVYDEDDAHRADYDATVLNDVWQPMIVKLTKDNPGLRHCDLGKLETPVTLLKHIRPYHMIAFAKNREGIKSLYKLVSYSHVKYLADVPKIPRKEIEKLRKDLILGSGCFNGEVFATAQYYNDDALKDVMKFYDYIEIQPLANYSHLVNMGDLEEEEVVKYLKDIVRCADEIGKPVCATGDVHYLTPKEKKFRDVYISAKGLGGALHPLNPYARSKKPPFENPDQHYRSTDEMLECMSFLGPEKAYEVTIKNTNMIADQIESLLPVPNDHLYTPTIENCENMLKDMCYNKAHELYGDPLPEYIEKRLATELNGIINGGYSVIYYIAHRLVKKANEDGFIVGSRGSVGSSFVATMSGITEVNPLPPHYRCPHCRHLEWTTQSMPEYKSGYDLPDKNCPVCGTKMIHDGQNIPFATFLGFKADKVPDIDLNFPGDYQARAHDYTKVLLGEHNVFRAGTIAGVEIKTAFGFARGYIERQGINPDTYPKAKIAYLASGCTEVKRTTGQHPGGIVVIPTGYEVYDFTPVQYPADDADANWQTTHFDFHSIHDTILKLDLLGHVDPMALKMMSTLTGIRIEDIPLNDKKVFSLFSSPAALNMNNDYLQAKTGAMAIPEFGTEFVRGMLEQTHPKTFNDLVIISGLSHGTGVWTGNADKIIEKGQATLQEVIGCRDDIMTYLQAKGLEDGLAFKIMEDVRHGLGLKPEYVEIMKANNVPQFYIDSCNLIKYMFPKGHAVAYVTMACRVGYFKVYYPLEFYATFFSVRSKQYDIETMIAGRDSIIAKLDEFKARNKGVGEKLSTKEAEQFKTLNIALEMIERGFRFSNIDLYKSDAVNFVIDHENKCLIPPFTTIDGLGENNAVTVIEARKDGPFYSKEELLRRTKLTTTNVSKLSEMHVLDGLSENDQLSLFDF